MMGLSNIETDGDGNRALIQWFALFPHPSSPYYYPSSPYYYPSGPRKGF
jgi:hypothetical protein